MEEDRLSCKNAVILRAGDAGSIVLVPQDEQLAPERIHGR